MNIVKELERLPEVQKMQFEFVMNDSVECYMRVTCKDKNNEDLYNDEDRDIEEVIFLRSDHIKQIRREQPSIFYVNRDNLIEGLAKGFLGDIKAKDFLRIKLAEKLDAKLENKPTVKSKKL